MKFPKPWYRKSRRAWFVTLDGQQINLGTRKEKALSRYQDLMAKPDKRVVPSGSLLAVFEAFLDWCQKHRAPDTYDWYRFRLESFGRSIPICERRISGRSTSSSGSTRWTCRGARSGITAAPSNAAWPGQKDRATLTSIRSRTWNNREVASGKSSFRRSSSTSCSR